MPTAYIAFGSNLGDRERNIALALKSCKRFMSDIRSSGCYETEQMYVEDQPPFLNGVFFGETTLSGPGLLVELKAVEREVGRLPREQNGPREIDLDIIWYEGHEEAGKTLNIPHPRARERRFVLEPLNEIAPDLLLPGYGVVRELLNDPGVQSQQVRRVLNAPILL